MRTLEETLIEQAEIAELDAFDYEVLQHLAIAYKFNNVHVRFYVNEKFGVYDGLKELEKILSNDIVKRYWDKREAVFTLDYTRDQFKDIPNIFFEHLHLNIDMTKNEGAEYHDWEAKLNPKTLLIKDAIIDVIVRNDDDIPEHLRHELTHGYNQYQSMLKGSNYFAELSTSKFYKEITSLTFNSARKWIRKSLYLTLDEEQNAFVAQLSGELEKNRRLVKTPMDALRILKNSTVYKAYKSLYYYINLYKAGRLRDSEINIITDEYNKISGTQLTTNKVFKKLEFLINKSNRKLDNIIGKLCLENLNNASGMAPQWLYIEDRDFSY